MGRQHGRPPRSLSRRVPRRVRDRRPHGGQPPSLQLGTTAHRGAEQRARRGIARDQRLRGQALRLQRRGRDRGVRRDPARVQGLHGRLRSLRPVPVDQHGRQRGRRWCGVGARRRLRWEPRSRRGGLDPARLDQSRLVARHDRRRDTHPHRGPEPERDRERGAQRRAGHRQAAPAASPYASPRTARRRRPQRRDARDPRGRGPDRPIRRRRRGRRGELPRDPAGGGGADRAERRREDDDHRCLDRLHEAGRGSNAPQRHADGGTVLGADPARARGHPAFLPVTRALRGSLGRGEPARRCRGAQRGSPGYATWSGRRARSSRRPP